MFFHEQKAKRLKAIKSKEYRRHERKRKKFEALKKAAGMGGDGDMDIDPEEAREAEEKAEFARAEERLLLKHRNTSRWAKRAIKKGLNNLPGTREAIAEQLRMGAALTQKVKP